MDTDFLILYAPSGERWAKWIAWQLEENGYSTHLDAWDGVAGSSVVGRLQHALRGTRRTIALLSDDFVLSAEAQRHWGPVWLADPVGSHRTLIPIRISSCDPLGLWADLRSFDLFELSESVARSRLLEGVRAALSGRAKPGAPPPFPGRRLSESSVIETGAPLVEAVSGGDGELDEGSDAPVVAVDKLELVGLSSDPVRRPVAFATIRDVMLLSAAVGVFAGWWLQTRQITPVALSSFAGFFVMAILFMSFRSLSIFFGWSFGGTTKEDLKRRKAEMRRMRQERAASATAISIRRK
ncbi:toll/interleukin-1 receptor domain-containing protein [Pseudofrankia inefficax]|uniref:toll/interleukin-1 receptor domain-containing protein n=1 Tax=Pseudofrankia inefficax (strain DSM 45817 / CECT 9037 / DDB 130130 / EuI1c) TaxID=298654 RepID=UPI0008FBC337|nr:toll/interleukin-1 receptor domain-containing protein [Pseudofrankia inefficax]